MATATKSASSNAAVGTGWTSPTNAYADDGTVAAFSGANGVTWTTDYGFADFTTGDIPDSATVTAVTMSANVWQSNAARGSTGVLCRNNGADSGTEATSTSTSTSNVVTATSSGVTLTDLRSASTLLKARVRCSRTSSQAFTGSLDYVFITVTYTDHKVALPTAASLTLTGGTPAVGSGPVVRIPSGGGANYANVIATDGPIRWFRFGEPSGSTMVDATGTANGTYPNTPTFGTTSLLGGDSNTAVTITPNGASSPYGVVKNNGALLGPLTASSVECLFKTSAAGSFLTLYCERGATGDATILFKVQVQNGLFGITWSDSTAGVDYQDFYEPSGVDRRDGARHHVVVTLNSSNDFTLYVDGTAITPSGGAGNSGGRTFSAAGLESWVGADKTDGVGTGGWDGILDELSLWNVDLSSAQVSAHYAALDVPPGLVLTGATPTVTVSAGGGVSAQPTKASLTLSAGTPTVVAVGTYAGTPTVASLTLSAGTPTVSKTNNVQVSPTTSALTLSAGTPTVTKTNNVQVSPTTAALTLSVGTPAVTKTNNVQVSPTTSSLTLTTGTPSVVKTNNVQVSPTVAALTLTGATPTVQVGGSVTVSPTSAALSLTGATPTVVATGGSVSVTPTTAALTLSAATPTVVAIGSYTGTPTTAGLNLSTAIPTVTRTLNQVSLPTVAALTMTAFNPAVVLSDYKVAQPTAAALDLLTATPTVAVAGQRTEWIPQPGYAARIALAGRGYGAEIVPGIAAVDISLGRTYEQAPPVGVAVKTTPSKGVG